MWLVQVQRLSEQSSQCLSELGTSPCSGPAAVTSCSLRCISESTRRVISPCSNRSLKDHGHLLSTLVSWSTRTPSRFCRHLPYNPRNKMPLYGRRNEWSRLLPAAGVGLKPGSLSLSQSYRELKRSGSKLRACQREYRDGGWPFLVYSGLL